MKTNPGGCSAAKPLEDLFQMSSRRINRGSKKFKSGIVAAVGKEHSKGAGMRKIAQLKKPLNSCLLKVDRNPKSNV